MRKIALFLWFCLLGYTLFHCKKYELPACTLSAEVIPTTNSAQFYGKITDFGGSEFLTQIGYCVSLYGDPKHNNPFVIIDSVLSDHTSSDFYWIYEFSTYDTVYYIRAFVQNSAGLSYSNLIKFSTKDTLKIIN